MSDKIQKSYIKEYLKTYRKKFHKNITLDKFRGFLETYFSVDENVYSLSHDNKLSKLYTFSETKFNKIILNPNYIILFLKNDGLIIYGAINNMLKINIIKPYLDCTYSENIIQLTLKDTNGILRKSIKIIETTLNKNQIFYGDNDCLLDSMF